MKKIIHILLVGLVATGLASCDKQELGPSGVSEVYTVEIEEDTLLTKASSAIEIENGSQRTFYATLRKSSDGGNTWTYVSHSNWDWNPPTNCSIKPGSQNNNDSRYGVTAGSVVIVGNSVKTATLQVFAKSTPAGELSQAVAVAVTPRPSTVTFNFNPDIESLVTINVPASQTQKWVNASQQIVIWDKGSASCSGAAFVDFFSYTGWTLSEVNSQFNSSTRDTRVLHTSWETTSNTIYVGISNGGGSYVEVYEGEQGGGSLALKWSGTPSVSLSAGSSTTPSNYPSGYNSSKFKAVYQLTVNSDMTVTVNIQ